jgi:hypothetical protein
MRHTPSIDSLGLITKKLTDIELDLENKDFFGKPMKTFLFGIT